MALDIVYLSLSMGTFYALIAIGLSAIFGIMRVVNFAHGEFFMIGAYTYSLISLKLGVPPFLALVPAILVGCCFGLIVERLLLRPLYSGSLLGESAALRDEYAVIITFALSLVLVNAAVQAFGPYPLRGPGLIDEERIIIGPIATSGHRLVAFGVGVAVLAAVACFFRFSTWGKIVQAVAQNRFGITIAGVNAVRVNQFVFCISSGMASLSGALLAPLFHADPYVGALPAVKSFVIVILGGMGSIGGAIVGAYVVAIVEQLGATYVSSAYRDAYGFILLIAVLVIRPQGFFGQRVREL